MFWIRIGYGRIDNTGGDGMYPMCLGISCASFALQLLGKPDFEVEKSSSKVVETKRQRKAQLSGLIRKFQMR